MLLKAYRAWPACARHRMQRTGWGQPSWRSQTWVRGPPRLSFALLATPMLCFWACMRASYRLSPDEASGAYTGAISGAHVLANVQGRSRQCLRAQSW